MRTVVLFACFSLVCLSSLAQNEGLVVINGPAFVDTESVSIDPDDNVLVVGNFDNGVNLGGTNYDGSGSFLLKLSKDGTPLWHRVIRYAGDNRVLRKVDTDATGNVYIAGNFSQSVTVEGHYHSSSYPYSGYVAKFDPQGNVQWTKVVANVKQFFGMKVNAVGQMLLYSMQSGAIAIDNISVAAGINSAGIMLNSSGTVLWVKPLGDLNRYTTSPRACAIDNSGSAYFYGIFSGTLAMDGQQATSNFGNYNYFITKLNSAGVCQWISTVDRAGPAANETSNPPDDLLAERGALEVDEQGNTYLGGYSWTGIRAGSISLNDEGTCVIKFDITGKVVWAKLGEAISFRGTVENMIVDNGRVYVSGLRSGGLYFSVYDTDGTFTRSGGTTRFPASIPSGLDVNSEHQVYLCGRIAYGAARLQGFVLNYGMPINLPGPAGLVTAPTAICPSETVSLHTNAIDFAASYEWEINRRDGTRFIVERYVPELHLRLSDYNIISDFSIRVRGRSEVGTGSYSAEEIVRVERPVDAPTLVIKCGIISIEHPAGITTLDWYFNDAVAEEYGRTSTSIAPAVEGLYHVTVDDVCGPVGSKKIEFVKTKNAPTLLVNCGKISVEHPEGVTAVDWYFNGALAEEYGHSNTSITPNKNGIYSAEIDDGCGAVPSKQVTFVAEEPKEAPALVVSCREISVVEPQSGVNLDWYFNNVQATEYGRTSTSIKPTNEGVYRVAIDDVCGPIVSNDVTFEFLRAADFELPNIITPNDDVYNQRFVVDQRLDSPRVVIFNRWGANVYAGEKYDNTWEGENLPSGVYYYQLDSKCLAAPIKGVLSIVR